ncbi:helix-turn-helix domain-containing protein [Nonomuraea phyllanthi]|uniref:helix-turn-helix domain-containing protein n=1 Tax=Nonomuraea phyllanthi TaxID=2219224 RepID=UPI001D1456F2|nr:helix-turn-helix domain-containing protein [Nonomuraea phyllanthi]
MRSASCLAAGEGFRLDTVTCVDDHRGWSAAEVGSGHHLVLVRRGLFRRRADGRAALIDPTMAYLGMPGEEEHFAHPAGGDVCTSVSLSPELWRTLAGDGSRPSRPFLYVDARLDLAHRRFLAAARTGDAAFALAESLLSLIWSALPQLTDASTARDARVIDGAARAIGTPAPQARVPAPGNSTGRAAETPALPFPKPSSTTLRSPDTAPRKSRTIAPPQHPALRRSPSTTAEQSPDTPPWRSPNAAPQQNVDITPRKGPSAAPQQNPDITPRKGPSAAPHHGSEPSVASRRRPRPGAPPHRAATSGAALKSGVGVSSDTTVRSSAAIADAAREAIATDDPAAGGLMSLAELLAVSPYQLSRAFTRELGVSLTHYRNRVRVGRALDRLEDGATSLAGLAADLGFSDQAHLTRTIRRHVGHTPTALRRLLAVPPEP